MSVLVPVNCTACRFKGNCLPGRGPKKPKLMVVADLPTGQDLRAGEAMKSDAGVLQKAIIRNILGLDPDKDVYYTYAIKGDTRGEAPDGKEVQACRTWLLKEIAVVQPEFILAAGTSAKNALLGTNYPMYDYRGKLVEDPIYGWKIFVTWNTGYVERYSSFRLEDEGTRNEVKIREFKTGSVPYFYKRDLERFRDILQGASNG